MNEKILIVEDDHKILRFIRSNLEASNYIVITAEDGHQAIELFEQTSPNLVLLDIMLPYANGFEVLGRIRSFSNTPVIMLTARGGSKDVINGLRLGADDYVIKPFDINELLARIEAVLRRFNIEAPHEESAITLGPIEINLLQQRVCVNRQAIDFTPTEYKLLCELIIDADKLLTHEHLLTKIWGAEYRDETHYLRVCIARLRKKLKITAGIGYIQTIPTVGYRMLGA